MGKFHELVEKFESEEENAFADEKQQIKTKTKSGFGKVWSFVKNNWLLVLIAIICYQAMIYAEEASRQASYAADYAGDASYYAREASDYAETAADFAEEAADDAAYIKRWSY